MSLSIEKLKNILSENKHYINRDGSLNINELHKKAQECEPYLIELLVENNHTRNAFFLKKGSHQVFMRDKFIDYITHKDFLANSYTRYKNKIGLSCPTGFLKKQNDVVLNFPFKDCVLEGGQSKDEEKRNEIYFNEVLDRKEIDQLLDRKVFTNLQRVDQHGIHSLKKWNRDKKMNQKRNLSENTITDNLIIKGNNLLALHTIKREFSGKVKLIYIDPPYNTGNDSFHYNDNFNHSTWLVFMKNRLEIARELLKEDGVIFVQCDDNEQAYLKVLMDEIFGRENFIINHVYKRRKTQANLTKFIAPIHEHILSFSKNINQIKFYNLPLKKEYIKKMYKNPDNDKRGLWRLAPLLRPANSKNKEFELTMPNDRIIKGKWSCSEETFKQYVKNDLLYITNEGSPNKKIFLNENKGQIPNSWLDNIATTEESSKEIENLFGSNNAFSYAKPEGIIQYIFQISTQENDIILDYHLGSGTTSAVAHKMNRQYIGIEQMDYIENIAVERIKKVIDGEQGGISKSVNWKSGGEFVYMELKKYNQFFIELIQKVQTTKELLNVKQQILEKAFLDFRLDTEAIKQNQEEFIKLKLSDQKQVLFEFLDKNQLYINYSEKDDERYECTEQEKKLSNEFYRDE